MREIEQVAERANLANPHPQARGWCRDKVAQAPDDWDSRALLTVPGLVWTISSDTCMTGRPSAPNNIAYDEMGREFVFRQPTGDDELAAIMSADSEEVFACYRFDGLERWTRPTLDAWFCDRAVITGWLSHRLASETEAEIVEGLKACHAYWTSDEFREYLADFDSLVRAKPEAVRPYTRRR